MDNSKVKNYLVILLGKVKLGPEWSPSATGNLDLEDKYPLYQEMAKLVESSAWKHLKGLDEVKYITGTFENIDDLFESWFMETRKLWLSERCNVLTAGCDVLFVRESDMFNEYEDYSLFGVNSFSSFYLDKVCADCGSIALDSVRYLPHTMEKDILEYGKELWANKEIFEKVKWGGEMAVNNKIFYKQRDGFYRDKKNLMEHLMKSKPYQLVMEHGAWDRVFEVEPTLLCPMEEAKILVFSATRGHRRTLEAMTKYNKQFNCEG